MWRGLYGQRLPSWSRTIKRVNSASTMACVTVMAVASIFSLARSLEEPNRSAFIKAATEAVEKLGPNAHGPGIVHRLLGPLWRQFFHPPSETSLPNRSRAYYDAGHDPEDRAPAKFARAAARQTEEGSQNRRRPVVGIRHLIE
jgi:hypothetical protein